MLQIFRMPEGKSVGIGNDHEANYFMRRVEGGGECPVARLELTYRNIINFFGDQFAVAFRMPQIENFVSFHSNPPSALSNGDEQEARADFVYTGPRLQDNQEPDEIYELIGSVEQLYIYVALCQKVDSELRGKQQSVSLEGYSLQDIDIILLAEQIDNFRIGTCDSDEARFNWRYQPDQNHFMFMGPGRNII